MTAPNSACPRLELREVRPVTPRRRAVPVVVGDELRVGATVVRDGHGILAARVRWRAEGTDAWSSAPLLEVAPTVFEGALCAVEPGHHTFVVEAWLDRIATWRRDLRVRAHAGDDLGVHFEVGARLLEDILEDLDTTAADRVGDAVATLRDTRCAPQVRLAAGLDDALADILHGVPDPVELTRGEELPLRVDRELAVRGAWYELFPRSLGGFRRGSALWDRVEDVAAAGFDVLYLPPIHPVGTTHRKGRDNSLVAAPGDVGSPWAIGSTDGGHLAVHPDLGDLSDVENFVAHVRSLGMEVALDYALQCSPDHPWVRDHPEWFTVLPDGSIQYAENPPKKYQDIYPINFWPDDEVDRLALWTACEEVLEFWIARGVEVFRVDNPHTKPVVFWEWMLRRVQARHPRVVFLSEAFTTPAMMHTLAEVGFHQSYTYFTWRESVDELRSYGEELAHAPPSLWFRPNLWPNTPDILAGVLRNGRPAAFRIRSLLAATMAPSWGVYSGFELCENRPASPEDTEYLGSEKYQLVQRDFDRPDSLEGWFALLNAFRREHPATWRMQSLRFHQVEGIDVMAYSHVRPGTPGGTDRVLVVVNISPHEVREATVHVDLGALHLSDGEYTVRDALDGAEYRWSGSSNYVRLDPAERVAHLFSVHQ